MHRLHPVSLKSVRTRLRRWYESAHRDLPWRRSVDPFRIWLSEVMLQQTRVAAVIPYYERFLARFPDAETLAAAPESDLLSAWAGLGYYSRARNLQKAARSIAAQGKFPEDYEGIRALAGVGDYTAAAIASIAFNLPYAVVDGNVLRVLSRFSNEAGEIGAASTRARLRRLAASLLDPVRPGDHNQAVMELGATVCLPKKPLCSVCPMADFCEARIRGTAHQLPVKLRRAEPVFLDRALLKIERKASVLMWQRGEESTRMRGFWELPEPNQLPQARIGELVGEFRHTITRHHYRFRVLKAKIQRVPDGFQWIDLAELRARPISTIARKALGI